MSFDLQRGLDHHVHFAPGTEEATFSSVRQNAALRQSNRYLEISALRTRNMALRTALARYLFAANKLDWLSLA
jgi:hypothetical protein